MGPCPGPVTLLHTEAQPSPHSHPSRYVWFAQDYASLSFPVRILRCRAGLNHLEPSTVQLKRIVLSPLAVHTALGRGLSSPANPWELKHREGAGPEASTATQSRRSRAGTAVSSRRLHTALPTGQQAPLGQPAGHIAALVQLSLGSLHISGRAGRESAGLSHPGTEPWTL